MDMITDKPTKTSYVAGTLYDKDPKVTGDAIKFIEKTYPETAKEFQRLQFEQYNLFCKKQMDYGPSNISMGTPLSNDDEKRLSLVGLIVRINDKFKDY